MKQISLFLLLMIATTSIFAQNIVINEVQSRNTKTYQLEKQSEYYDWIELKNTTSSEVDLSGWFLSDNSDKPKKWTFPADTKIQANSYLIVFSQDDYSYDEQLHCNFNLSSTGETLVLSDNAETEIHRLEYSNLLNDMSYGLLDDGSFSYMSSPTPKEANNITSAFVFSDKKLTISLPSGLYPDAQTVDLTTDASGQIYYTLDGTNPTATSTLYTSSINITSSCALKATVLGVPRDYIQTENRSYIIGASHSLPVVLLTSDNLSSDYWNKDVIDGRVEFCFIETDGTTVINQYANYKASGKTSDFFPQLNGKVRADKLYGDSDFDHKMYPDKDVDEFKSFLFRNSSQDWANTYLRDAFISNVLGQDNLTGKPYEAYRPAVIYVNGKYHGITNIREDADNDYIEHNYGLKEGDFVRGYYPSFVDFYSLDFNKETDRQTFDKLVNFHEHLSMKLLYAFTEVGEWGWRYWEDISEKTDYRFHYNFHDFDPILGLHGDGSNKTAIETELMPVNDLFEDNIKNYEPYKNEALQYIAAQLNHVYNPDRTLNILDEMQNNLKDEIPAHAIKMTELANKSRIGFNENEIPFPNITVWNKSISDVRTNISNRIDAGVFNRIKDEYSLDATINITYATSDINKGKLKVHDVKVLDESFTGTYFSNIPFSLSAEALPGFKFVRWEGDYTGTDREMSTVFTSDASITAVFEAIETNSDNIVINEVQSKNDNTIADETGEFDDWIEIYNPTDTDIDIAGYYISDNFDEPLKWKIPATDASKTTVSAKGFLLLWADKDTEQGITHLDFKLKGTDQIVLTKPDGKNPIQYIEFTDVETDKSYAAKNDASSVFAVNDAPTPNKSNGTTISEPKKFNVVFNDYDNSELKTETVEFEKSANAPANPTRVGYTFTSWDIDFSKITADLTVTAQYSINTFNVVFNDYDNSDLKTEIVEFEKSANAPANPTREGYTFKAWDITFDKVTADLIVTAQYDKVTGINDITIGEVNIYPNPVNDILHIDLNDNFDKEALIVVYNSKGQIIFKHKIYSNSLNINTEFWQTDLYLLIIKTDKIISKNKILKQ